MSKHLTAVEWLAKLGIGRVYIDVVDMDNGLKSYHVCNGGQTICAVHDDLFDHPWAAKRHAEMIVACINATMEASRE
jgi:hypothetical protein